MSVDLNNPVNVNNQPPLPNGGPVNNQNNNGDQNGAQNVQQAAQGAFNQANNQQQGQAPVNNAQNIGNQVNGNDNAVDQDEPEAPPPQQPSSLSILINIARTVAKYILPILFLGAGITLFSVAIGAAAMPPALPFLLITGGALLLGVGGVTWAQIFSYDIEKEQQIQELNKQLEKAKKEKGEVSSSEALKNEINALDKKINEKTKRVNELKGLNPLTQQQQKELTDLENELIKLNDELARKKRWLKKLEDAKADGPQHQNRGQFAIQPDP